MNLLYTVPTLLADHDGPPWRDGEHEWMWVFGPLFGLLWLALFATVVWLIVRRNRPRERSAADRARDILAERFARGEITPEEYRERLSQLG